MDEPAKIIVRAVQAQDRNFLMSFWLRGVYSDNLYFKRMPKALFYKEYTDYITRILFTPGVEVLIACGEKEPDWIVGFAIVNKNELYWISVKNEYKRKGVAALLLSGRDISVYKTFTPVGETIAKSKGWAFNPF